MVAVHRIIALDQGGVLPLPWRVDVRCFGKWSFDTAAEAHRVLDRRRRLANRMDGRRVYRCPRCHKFHEGN